MTTKQYNDLDAGEFEEINLERQKALEQLAKIGEEVQKYKEKYEAENDAWWNSLSEKEREDAFYAVCKRIYQGELVDKGTYRYILYDVFGFDHAMYGAGMDCGFMAIHNSIMNDEQFAEANKWMAE